MFIVSNFLFLLKNNDIKEEVIEHDQVPMEEESLDPLLNSQDPELIYAEAIPYDTHSDPVETIEVRMYLSERNLIIIDELYQFRTEIK